MVKLPVGKGGSPGWIGDWVGALQAERSRIETKRIITTHHHLSPVVLSKKFKEFIPREFSIAQDLAQEAASDVLTRMNRDGDNAAVRMSHPHVTSFLPDDPETGSLQGSDDVLTP